jgi:hypothetical protein
LTGPRTAGDRKQRVGRTDKVIAVRSYENKDKVRGDGKDEGKEEEEEEEEAFGSAN